MKLHHLPHSHSGSGCANSVDYSFPPFSLSFFLLFFLSLPPLILLYLLPSFILPFILPFPTFFFQLILSFPTFFPPFILSFPPLILFPVCCTCKLPWTRSQRSFLTPMLSQRMALCHCLQPSSLRMVNYWHTLSVRVAPIG